MENALRMCLVDVPYTAIPLDSIIVLCILSTASFTVCLVLKISTELWMVL
jgi:hypothetical protein